LSALRQAIHDKKNHPSVILLCWGGPEESWTSTTIQAINATLQEAARLSITVVVAAGDAGITDGSTDGNPHLDFPVSRPFELTVGVARLSATKEAIVSEVALNGSVGGLSSHFPQPEWQKSAKIAPLADGSNARGMPDVAIAADPSAGYVAFIGGHEAVVGGTGAGAALWAGLIARI